jgi:hypothetical protein
LWNLKPENPATSNSTEARVMTDYAFSFTGNYFIKVILGVSSPNRLIKIESQPIKVAIEEPAGENLLVWKKIKDRGDLGYFIQQDDFLIPSYKVEEREKLQREIEQIIIEYPDTIISSQLKKSLEKFQKNEQLIKSALEKRNKSQ